MLGGPGKLCPSCFHRDETKPIQEEGPGTEFWASTREDLEEMWVAAKGIHTQPLGIANLVGQMSPVRREDTDMLRGRER